MVSQTTFADIRVPPLAWLLFSPPCRARRPPSRGHASPGRAVQETGRYGDGRPGEPGGGDPGGEPSGEAGDPPRMRTPARVRGLPEGPQSPEGAFWRLGRIRRDRNRHSICRTTCCRKEEITERPARVRAAETSSGHGRKDPSPSLHFGGDLGPSARMRGRAEQPAAAGTCVGCIHEGGRVRRRAGGRGGAEVLRSVTNRNNRPRSPGAGTRRAADAPPPALHVPRSGPTRVTPPSTTRV